MKKFLKFSSLLIFFVGLSAILATSKVERSSKVLSPKNIVEPTIAPTKNSYQLSSKFSENEYQINWIVVENVDQITLKSNLEEKLTAKDIVERESCQHLISGGFFTLESKHIGLFVSEGEKLSEAQNSNLFNGYFYVEKNGKAGISSSVSVSPRLALQSGPILMKDGKPQILSLKNDEHAKRIVVTANKDEQVIFMAVYDKNNYVAGPLLSELPNILLDLKNNTELDFQDALNLDGGAHSAFISDLVTLTELSTIGSCFCINF